MSDQQDNDEQWRDKLTPAQYHICREKGTEPAFTGEYWNHWEEGVYDCRCCGKPLFDAGAKYDAGCGWPSFSEPLAEEDIGRHLDRSFGMERVEVTCKHCGCHLGHVFPDGPQPDGLRYCINSASIQHRKGAGTTD